MLSPRTGFEPSNFGFVSDFGFRISDFIPLPLPIPNRLRTLNQAALGRD